MGIKKQKWNYPESAPKDGTQILADVGLPWAVVAVWCSHDEKWVYPNLQACDMANGTTDTYFENEQESTIKGWLPLPELPASKAWHGVDADKFVDDLRIGELDLTKEKI